MLDIFDLHTRAERKSAKIIRTYIDAARQCRDRLEHQQVTGGRACPESARGWDVQARGSPMLSQEAISGWTQTPCGLARPDP